MFIALVAAIALAVVAGFWYSYYQSVRKLRAHDRETVRLMEADLAALIEGKAPDAAIAAQRERLRSFRVRNRIG